MTSAHKRSSSERWCARPEVDRVKSPRRWAASLRAGALLPAALLLSIVAVVLLSVREAYLESLARIDGPAQVMVLPEAVLVLASLVAILATWRLFPEDPRAHVATLLSVAVAHWLTPFLLAGFLRLPDTAWHLGAARFLDALAPGADPDPAGLHYVESLPGAFVVLAPLLAAAGEPGIVGRVAFPAFAILAFVLLAYALGRRLVSPPAALLGVGLFVVVSTNVEFHPSPRAVMTVLLAACALALTLGRAAHPFLLVLGPPLALAHPLGAALLGALVLAALVPRIANRGWGRAESVAAGIAGLALAGSALFLFFGPPAYARLFVLPDAGDLVRLFAPRAARDPAVQVARAALPLAVAIGAMWAVLSNVPKLKELARSSAAPPVVFATALIALLAVGFLIGGSGPDRAGRDRALFFLLFLAALALAARAVRDPAGRRALSAVGIVALLALPAGAYAYDSAIVTPPAERGSFDFVERMDLRDARVASLRYDRAEQLLLSVAPLGSVREQDLPRFLGPPENATVLDREADVFLWRRSLDNEGVLLDDPSSEAFRDVRALVHSRPDWSVVYDSGAAEIAIRGR